MKIVGLIAEYNPFHNGHQYHIEKAKEITGADAVIVVMSGNFVQRGAPAIVDKMHRAKAAVLSGADLVLELPVTCVLSSAEGFASGGISILSGFCDALCFGGETANPESLMNIARNLLTEEFSHILKKHLELGISFPAAREAALSEIGCDASVIRTPNNILAVEYCKAILAQNSSMKPMPILRQGSYHDTLPDPDNPSATAVRALMVEGGWERYVPEEAVACFKDAPLHVLSAGERAILMRLRTMTGGQYELVRAETADNIRSKSGLELNVIDHYNGSQRSVRSLSGGESFKASLALALGLSDVVQSTAGGIQLDAMFIDEGFGSLDEESLEQAMAVLGDLSAGNRLIGIISHVGELKRCIDRQVIVIKDRSGGSRVHIEV